MTRRVCVVLALAAALTLAVALPAGAGAAIWTAPERVSDEMSAPGCCRQLQFSDAGNGLAIFTTNATESHTAGALAGTRFLTRDPAGGWSERATRAGARRAFRTLGQRVTADGQVLIFGTPVRFRPYRDHPTGLAVRHAHLTASGLTVDSTELLRKGAAPTYDFAANETGDAVVAWAVRKGKHRGVYVRRAKSAGEFGRLKRLTTRTPRFGSVLAAVGRNGHTVVAWERRRHLYVRIARLGAAFESRVDLGRRGLSSTLGCGPRGEVIVATLRRAGPFRDFKDTLDATLTGPMGASPSRTQLAGPSDDVYARRSLVTFDRRGRALVVFPNHDATHVATFDGGAPTIQTIQPNGDPIALESGPDGQVGVLTATYTPNLGNRLYVALRRPDGSFEPGEPVTPYELIDGAALAFDPLTDEPTVLYLVWLNPGDAPIDAAYVVRRSPG
jgi:hypothetical protein